MSGGHELNLPPGFRFHPTDEELVMHYLCRRCAGAPIAVPIITEIDLYKFDPWQLPSTCSIPSSSSSLIDSRLVDALIRRVRCSVLGIKHILI
jgi:hypothetical protein